MDFFITNLDSETFINTATTPDLANIRLIDRGKGKFFFLLEHGAVAYQTDTHDVLDFAQFANLFKQFKEEKQACLTFGEYCEAFLHTIQLDQIKQD